jgi:hypothetical protein
MKRAALVAGAVLALTVTAGVVSTLADAGAFRALSPHGFEQCARVDVTGSEDIVFDPVSGLVFVSSTDFRALDRGAPSSGAIWAWNPALPRRRASLTTLAATSTRTGWGCGGSRVGVLGSSW